MVADLPPIGDITKLKDTLFQTASRLLERPIGPVVRIRLLRDVLRLSPGHGDLLQAEKSLTQSLNIARCAAEQHPDGSWGAFHSMNSRLKQRIPSTEVGVERALALGLDANHALLQSAAGYLQNLLRGALPFPDRPEKNNRWPTGARLFTAATLARIQPDHPLLMPEYSLWARIAALTFQTGQYSAEDEIAAHQQLTGATVKNSYLVLAGRYQLALLSAKPGLLSPPLEEALVDWVWHRPQGIGYLCVPLHQPPHRSAYGLEHWLASLELLARFPACAPLAAIAIHWLLDNRDADGFWDFGPRSTSGAVLPLSDDWKTHLARQSDWTARVLILLYYFLHGYNQEY